VAKTKTFSSGWILVGIVVALLAVASVFWLRKGDDGKGQVKTVTVAAIASPHQGKQAYGSLTGVVVRQGWLKEELEKKGIALELVPVPTSVGGPLVNEGFSGKRSISRPTAISLRSIAVSGGVPLKLVVPVGMGQNGYLVARNGLDAKSIVDLKGKRIALHRGRPWELSFTKLAEANGLKLSDFTIVNINPSATPAALASGNVDAAFLLADGLLIARTGAAMSSGRRSRGRIPGGCGPNCSVGPTSWRPTPSITQIVADAYVRAAAWSAQEANKPQVLHDAARGSLPEAIVAEDYQSARTSWRDRFSPLFSPALVDHYRSVADYTLRARADAQQGRCRCAA
jgi:sulfonate transport system substrate-binding protein